MKQKLHLFALVLAASLAACGVMIQGAAAQESAAAATPAAPQADKAARLDALYAQYWEQYLELNPIAATFQGDPRYNDRLPNSLSEEYRNKTHDFNTRWLEQVEAIGPEGLEEQDLISYQIFVRDAKQELAAEEFPDWLLPIDQFRNLAAFRPGHRQHETGYRGRRRATQGIDGKRGLAARRADQGQARGQLVLDADPEHAEIVLGGGSRAHHGRVP